jgi:hypothetical protein
VNNIKFGVLVGGLLGLIGCFLPYISEAGLSMSFFGIRELGAGQVYMTMAGFVITLVMGVMAAAKPPMLRWQAIVAALGSAFVLFKLRGAVIDGITHGAIGAKLMSIGAIVGLVFAVLAAAKPEAAK